MEIDMDRADVEILEDIYKHTINNLDIDFKFKPDTDFKKWYNEDGQYVVFPHLDTDNAQAVTATIPHPAVLVSCDKGKITICIAYWSIAALELNLMAVLNTKNQDNVEWITKKFRSLKKTWDWQFKIHKKQGNEIIENSLETSCVKINDDELSDIKDKIVELREQWFQDSRQNKAAFTAPAVTFLQTTVSPEQYDEPAKIVFEVFSKLITMTSPTKIKTEWTKKKKRVEEFITTLEERLTTSKYQDAIIARVQEQHLKLKEIEEEYGMNS